MKRLMMISSVMLMTCAKPCPPFICSSAVDIALTADQRAVFDGGDTRVEVCVAQRCFAFTLAAGSTWADAPDGSLSLTGNTLQLASQNFSGGVKQDVKLTISRDTMRVEKTWPAVPFAGGADPAVECSQHCGTASVSTTD